MLSWQRMAILLAAGMVAAGIGNRTLRGGEPRPKSPQAIEQEIQAHNAARLDKGAPAIYVLAFCSRFFPIRFRGHHI
jgi:hypothetical protein